MKIGRPTLMTPQTISKLEEIYSLGGTDEEACFYADIAPATLYKYQEKCPDFVERKEALKLNPILKARRTVVEKLNESYINAIDYLKRKRKQEFGDNIDVMSGGKPFPIYAGLSGHNSDS